MKKEQYPGPFTTVEEVKLFLESLLEDKIKNNKLYKEIKYVRMTCMPLQPTAAVFRLMRNHCKLETKEYADNLITYLDSARTCRTITLDDLSNVLHGLSGKAKNGTNTEVPSSSGILVLLIMCEKTSSQYPTWPEVIPVNEIGSLLSILNFWKHLLSRFWPRK